MMLAQEIFTVQMTPEQHTVFFFAIAKAKAHDLCIRKQLDG